MSVRKAFAFVSRVGVRSQGDATSVGVMKREGESCLQNIPPTSRHRPPAAAPSEPHAHPQGRAVGPRGLFRGSRASFRHRRYRYRAATLETAPTGPPRAAAMRRDGPWRVPHGDCKWGRVATGEWRQNASSSPSWPRGRSTTTVGGGAAAGAAAGAPVGATAGAAGCLEGHPVGDGPRLPDRPVVP